MAFDNRVRITRRFQRSISIDSDLTDPKSLEGFICPQSFSETLFSMAKHISDSGQGAFTWTGAYGAGKSSLAIALAAMLSGDKKSKKIVREIFDPKLVKEITDAFHSRWKGWKILPVVGSREEPVQIIGRTLADLGFAPPPLRNKWTQQHVLDSVQQVAAANSRTSGGLVIFIDEMGKFLEGASKDNLDLYIFQRLAELSNSNERIRVIGILHQSFDEYAYRLSREMRNEWSKVQGRFIDLGLTVTGDEQINLISRAIESDTSNKKSSSHTEAISKLICLPGSDSKNSVSSSLANCWPLHPVTACLLGPISRRRFGQNQRSVFGFLNSAEVHGFQYFLTNHSASELYKPCRLWDYLRSNLEPSIIASPDGHRWVTASSVYDRCEVEGMDADELAILKTIAVVDLFKDQSGLKPSFELLKTCFPLNQSKLKQSLKKLSDRRAITFKKFLGAYAIYAGSDFDIETAVSKAAEEIQEIDYPQLNELANLRPVLAKRHYHATGAMRWFEITISSLEDVDKIIAQKQKDDNSIGQFVLIVPAYRGRFRAHKLCEEFINSNKLGSVILGVIGESESLTSHALDLLALKAVRDKSSSLAGDDVARREIESRIAGTTEIVVKEIYKGIDNARWYCDGKSQHSFKRDELSILASDLADIHFDDSPKIQNELLCRVKPSTSASLGRKLLLHAMVDNIGQERLSISKNSVEYGLFASIIESTGLYRHDGSEWKFCAPKKRNHANLLPAWSAALNHIRENQDRLINVVEIYNIWRAAPFGIKDGVMPVLVAAFILAESDKVVVYQRSVFRSKFTNVDVDYLIKVPELIQLRWFDISDSMKQLLRGISDIVRDLGSGYNSPTLEPIDVGRGLIAIYDDLPNWTKHTMNLSNHAIQARDIFKRAHDPNNFLFVDLPQLAGNQKFTTAKERENITTVLREGLSELVHAYPKMLQQLRDQMLRELKVVNFSASALSQLRSRAENIRHVGGNFHIQAFVGRLSQYNGSDDGLEGISSLAVNKSPRNWIDNDVKQAKIALAELSKKFLLAETFAHVEGRTDKRQSIGVIIGLPDGKRQTEHSEFDVADTDKNEIDKLVSGINGYLINQNQQQKNLILAALAQIIHDRLTDSGDRSELMELPSSTGNPGHDNKSKET